MGNLLFFLAKAFFFKKVVSDLKKRGILFYLKTLQVARKSLAGALLIFCLTQIMIFGLFGAIITAIFLLPQDLEAKIMILLLTFVGMFFLTLLIFLYAMSEKVWYKASGIEEMMQEQD